MFRNTYQSGYLTIFNAVGSKPLQLWETDERDGHVTRVLDDLTRSSALELDGNNAATTSIACPPKRGAELGVTLPHLSFLVRAHRGGGAKGGGGGGSSGGGRGFSIEVEVRDDRGVRRRIRASTFQPVSRVAPGIASLPLRLEGGGSEGGEGGAAGGGKAEAGDRGKTPSSPPSWRWHRVPLDLDALVRRAWGTRHRETLRVTVHACCRLRCVYFSEKRYEGEAALPAEYRLYAPASAAKTSASGRGNRGASAAGVAAASAAVSAAVAVAGGSKAAKGANSAVLAPPAAVAAAAAAPAAASVPDEGGEKEPLDADGDGDVGVVDAVEVAEVATGEVVVDDGDDVGEQEGEEEGDDEAAATAKGGGEGAEATAATVPVS